VGTGFPQRKSFKRRNGSGRPNLGAPRTLKKIVGQSREKRITWCCNPSSFYETKDTGIWGTSGSWGGEAKKKRGENIMGANIGWRETAEKKGGNRIIP